MSSNACNDIKSGDEREFDLCLQFDDALEPERTTLVPMDAVEDTTEWLSIDAEFAVPLDETA